MPCSHKDCEAPIVISTATEDVENWDLCLTHLAHARGNTVLNPPYKFEPVAQRTGVATEAWPQAPKATSKRARKKAASAR